MRLRSSHKNLKFHGWLPKNLMGHEQFNCCNLLFEKYSLNNSVTFCLSVSHTAPPQLEN